MQSNTNTHKFSDPESYIKKLELIIESVANAVLVCDRNGDIKWANNGFTELTGYALEEVLGKDPFDALYSDLSDESIRIELHKKITEGQVVKETILNHDRNGKPYWLELRVNPIYDEKHELVNYVAIGIDVTERVRSAKETEERSNLLESISQTMPVVIYIWNIQESKIDYISNHILTLSGYAPEQFVGDDNRNRFTSIIVENDLPKLRESYKDLVANPEKNMASNSFRIKHISSGEIKRVNSKEVVYKRDAEGKPTHLICSMTDVTEHYNAERYREALIRLQELQQKRTQKIRTLTMLQGQEEERKRLSRDLHDGIGQLLTAIRIKINNLEGSTGSDSTETQLKEIKSIVQQTIRETRNISNALVPADLYDFGIQAAIKQLCDSSQQHSGINISFNSNLSDIRIDPTTEIEVYRIAQEALNNSLKYYQSKNIDVNIIHNTNGETLKLLIIDEGIGFDYQPDYIYRKSKIRSFGLRNMHERTRIINGKINIISQKGQGCVVALEIPLKQQYL